MRGRFQPKGLTEVEAMHGRGVARAVDLRTDAATLPSPEMRQAMLAAELGDDTYGEDPTVNRLESRAADLLGHEAVLFVVSGTMANQLAVHVHTRPGQEVICDSRSHLYNMEMAMAAVFSGCQLRPVDVASGRLTWGAVQPALRLDSSPMPAARTGLVVAENTHNLAGGVVSPPAIGADLCRELRQLEIPVHLDGARLFNAAVALGVEARELAAPFDSLMVCLDKGLGAPVGALLLGRKDFIQSARAARRMLGGGWRQAGLLAAAGLVALEKGPARLADDHALAQLLAAGCASIAGVSCPPPATNIVLLDVARTEFTSTHILARLAERNVLAHALDPARIRLVAHAGLDRAQCEEAVFALRAVIERG